MSEKDSRLDKADYVARARFRHQLRLFERVTEEACARNDVTLAQYLLLLQIKGRPGRDWALVGELAECLQLRHQTTVELTGRCELAGLVVRERDADDLRKVRVSLTRAGNKTVEGVAREHHAELERLQDHISRVLQD
jgi:DNA-binding MarR family transcriptional regulator